MESTSRKGLLAVTDQSTGKLNGIAIGLQTAAGVDIPLDQKVRVADLISGVNEIKLGAYIQAEQALTQNKIVYGQYQVTTNFTLDYQ